MSRESDFELAQQRIAKWQPGEILNLSLLVELDRLPESISKLTALQLLSCGGAQVSDLSPLRELTALQQLDCRNTKVSDLSPLRELTAVKGQPTTSRARRWRPR